ncbi:MAG TPA: hypothetical protein VGL98_05250 [Gammaproteobacteria bacterium]
MKIVFLLALMTGFIGTLAGAHFAPGLKQHDRLPSRTAVVANGGRAEEFVIRLPLDRISATDGEAGGLRSNGVDGSAMVLPAQFVAEPLLVEHFKVRDSAGNVIGVAARHWNGSADSTATWSVLIPSRGALVMSGQGEKRGALDAALRSRGYSAGKAWSGDARVSMTQDGAGVVNAGTGEFEGLIGTYTETWTVAGVDEDGKVSGTIELATVTSKL